MEHHKFSQLQTLAQLYQIETSHIDVKGRRQQATGPALWGALTALGAPLAQPRDIPGAITGRRLEIWRQNCPPVAVAWPGQQPWVTLRLPRHRQNMLIKARLQLENGDTKCWTLTWGQLAALDTATIDGTNFISKRLPLPGPLPRGYHQLELQWGEQKQQILLLAPPGKVYQGPTDAPDKSWGVFLPVYALRSDSNWGAGDMADLGRLSNWVRQQGGSFVGTLPLLANYLDTPYAPSPYSPVSRLFWNEFYLDLDAVPELGSCPQAQALMQHATIQKIRRSLNQKPLVDYRRAMAVKRSLLEILAWHHQQQNNQRQQQFRQWLQVTPRAKDYAYFRAAMEGQKRHWKLWPPRMRQRLVPNRDFDPQVAHYHLYVQWLIHNQLQGQHRQHGGLYLDLPLGVHSAGFDIWQEPHIFITAASCGAPPDPLNQQGQNWALAPLHPQRIRQQGYRYYIDVLRHHLGSCQMLRIDHIMGLHRMYLIPQGHAATDGVYIKYYPEEFYALLALESHRHQVQLIGEDLGTVPRQVRQAMDNHGLHRMYILPFETGTAPGQGVNQVPAQALAALNTHDMPPFAAHWAAQSRAEKLAFTSYLADGGQKKNQAQSTQAVLKAGLKFLATSPAKFLLINLEDLWLEKRPQNVPGTTFSHPNWQRKAYLSWENISTHSRMLDILRRVQAWRKPKDYQPQ